jgi:hypothetical protein
MSRQFSLPVQMPPVQLLAPTTTNGGATSRRFNMKNVNKAWIIVDLLQAFGDATAVTLNQATAITGGTTAAGPNVPIWANEDTVASDSRTKQTADASVYTVTNNIKSKQIIFEVDPSRLTAGSSYVFVTTSNSTQAANIANVTAVLQNSYQMAAPFSAVV